MKPLDMASLSFIDGEGRCTLSAAQLAPRAPVLAEEYVRRCRGTAGGALFDVILCLMAVDAGAAATFSDAVEARLTA